MLRMNILVQTSYRPYARHLRAVSCTIYKVEFPGEVASLREMRMSDGGQGGG